MPAYKVGDIVKCKVTGISSFGFFARVDDDWVGLCHISEMSYDFVPDVSEYVHDDEEIYAQIKEINEQNKQFKLSIKDIYYKIEDDGRIVETRKGFSPLKEMLPIWIESKIQEYKKS